MRFCSLVWIGGLAVLGCGGANVTPGKAHTQDAAQLDNGGSGVDDASVALGGNSGSGNLDADSTTIDLPQSDANTAVTGGPYCGCGLGAKVCGHFCEPIDEPTHGCASPSCESCKIPNALAKCADGACALYQCMNGWDNCDGALNSGCETNLNTDVAHCGNCATACAVGQSCVEGICVSGCIPPLTSCAGVCTNLLTSSDHCGGCTTPCGPAAGQVATCEDGQCVYVSAANCPEGLTPCGAECIDLTRDPENCGACDRKCSHVVQGMNACVNSQCEPCPQGLTACPIDLFGVPFSPGPGLVCVDTTRDSSNCASCGSPCAKTEFCAASTCVPRSTAALVTGLGKIVDIVVGDAVYFIDANSGAIGRISKNGGPVTVLTTSLAKPAHIAVDSGFVYWTEKLGAAVNRMPITGGEAGLVAVAAEPTELVVDNANIYWINNADKSVNRVPKEGGVGISLFQDLKGPSFLVQNATTLFCVATSVVFGSPIVEAIPKLGGPPTGVDTCVGIAASECDDPSFAATEDCNIRSLAVNESQVFFGCPVHQGVEDTSGLFAAPTSSILGEFRGFYTPSTTTLWTVDLELPTHGTLKILPPTIARGDDVFFVQGGAIRRATSCQVRWPEVIADVGTIVDFDVDDSYVYWTDGTMIGRLPR